MKTVFLALVTTLVTVISLPALRAASGAESTQDQRWLHMWETAQETSYTFKLKPRGDF